MSRAEYMREYRARRKQRGEPVPRGSKSASGRGVTKWRNGRFIAWDGEGVDTGRKIDAATNEHRMTLFANSDGVSVYDAAGLHTATLLDMFLSSAASNPTAIHVIYSGGYDFIHALHDLSFTELQTLAKTGEVSYRHYTIKYIPRKSFYVRNDRTRNAVTIWDVIGFFQSSFVVTIEKWLGADYADLPMIEAGKLQRSHFAGQSLDYIREYNDAELRALVLICER
ncbi:MAG: hypothetical protein KDK27_08720, partial [Leptospiraceae bacterium]|nr:hypothetical protein [Leptospiraceae bacterium]